MDDAFLPFSALIERAQALPGELVDDNAGVRSHIYECQVEMPVELDVSRNATGKLQIGSVPPLYYTATTFLPSFHKLSITLHLEEGANGV